jgi:hypothetical protein
MATKKKTPKTRPADWRPEWKSRLDRLEGAAADEMRARVAKWLPGKAKVERQDRIRLFVKLMGEGHWPDWPESRLATDIFAERVGVSRQSILEDLSLAHIVITLDPGERERFQLQVGERCLAIAKDAEMRASEVTGLPDYSAALKAYDQAARYLGVNLETRVNVSGSVTLEDVAEIAKRIGDANK